MRDGAQDVSMSFRELLLAKRKELCDSRGLSMNGNHDTGDSVDLANELLEIGVEVERHNRGSAVCKEINAALERVNDGTFGYCQECEEPIPAKRLDAVPWARRCVSCQEEAERSQSSV